MKILNRNRFCLGLVFIASLSGSGAGAEPTPKSVMANRGGMEALKKNSPTQAQEKFIEGLATTPFEARLHLNLGLTFEILGQPDKAQSAYETALKFAQDDQTRFTANFNLGEMQQKAKNKDEALRFYQAALSFNPDSEETKVNIELLTQDGKGGGGKGDKPDKKDQKDKEGKGDGKSEDQKDQDQKDKDQKDKDQKDKESDKNKDQKKEYSKSKPQPQKFKSEELTQGDVNKILGEIKQQEQKIRADFNKREVKEQPKDQDW